MEDRHKKCLRRNRSYMCSEISLSVALLAELSGSAVITDDQLQELQNIQRNETMKAAVLYFLTNFLPKSGPKAFDLFLVALRVSEQDFVADHLEAWLRDQGASSEDENNAFERVRLELQSYYKHRLRSIHPIPWLQAIQLSLTDLYVNRHLKLTANHEGGGVTVTMDDLFTTHEAQDIPRRLLIEGNPGMGKSTICQTFAHVWSLESRGDRFQRSAFGGRCHYKTPTSNDSITTNQLQEILVAKYVLLVVDAFDEAYSDNALLDQLIQGNILRNKTLLITSRPKYLQDKLKYFDSTFTLEGYDRQEQLEHVRRYAEYKKVESAPFESMLNEDNVSDLCNNPLNLTLLCLLREEDTQWLSSRTDLYTSIHNVLKRKASERLHLSPVEVEDLLLRPLYRLAFEAHKRNETMLYGSDFKKVENFEEVIQVGYLTKELVISRLQGEMRCGFTHQTFLEFLTAKNIALMGPEERLTWLRDLRYAKYAVQVERLEIGDSFDVPHYEPLLGFLFGLLEDNPEELTQMTSVVIDGVNFSKGSLISSLPDQKIAQCDVSHMLLRLMGELKAVHPKLEEVISKRCPPYINIYEKCSASCRKGIVVLGNLQLPVPIHLNVDLFYAQEDNILFVKKWIKCKSIDCSWISIKPRDVTEMRSILSELRVGREESFQHVSIEGVRINENPTEGFPFGDNLSGLQLNQFNSSHSCILEAVMNKPLTSLQLIHCDIDDGCAALLHRLLLNQDLRRVSLLSWEQHMGQFLMHLSQLNNLQSLGISLMNSTQQERRSLKAILEGNKLNKLIIYSDDFTDLYSVLNNSFTSMSSLRELHLKSYPKEDQHSIVASNLSNLHRLDLLEITLESKLTDDNLIVLSDAIRSWPNLQHLNISFVYASFGECSMRKLIDAIKSSRHLEEMRSDWLQIKACDIPDAFRNIKLLRLWNSILFPHDETLYEERFKQIETLLSGLEGQDT
ncbi:hypothetical protein CAPTEDRAFT_208074 [Capitella teleta]|uniref:CARD domain-containing protein n=1 Tax=Capitella teleta TaxID=283909 RepID=R7UX48_CAPTE|nr:hypothetical protein CAPTEDRAFT_208074 [Capitella teleta]|eukprot:ELU08487.1 hypothetical protein CAPTEDRAFT_208074 [Capitella teleta]